MLINQPIIQGRCACTPDVTMGSFRNQVRLTLPAHMRGLIERRRAAGLSTHDFVSIDRCLAPEIQLLWSQQITTGASCCGHNVAMPEIMVAAQDEPRMRDLGYVELHDPACSTTLYLPKSIRCELVVRMLPAPGTARPRRRASHTIAAS